MLREVRDSSSVWGLDPRFTDRPLAGHLPVEDRRPGGDLGAGEIREPLSDPVQGGAEPGSRDAAGQRIEPLHPGVEPPALGGGIHGGGELGQATAAGEVLGQAHGA